MRKLLVLLCSLLVPLASHAQIDLDSWNKLLGEAVSNGYVDYNQWRENPEFDALVTQIARTDVASLGKEQQLVFYINAYNILAARGILDGSSPSSLLGRYVYFKRDKYQIAGQKISLYDLEHQRILPLGEPRIHFAIVCASASCPILRDEAYRLDTLNEQLDDAARGFINDVERNRFDVNDKKAGLSKIFQWFTEDFEVDGGTLQEYIANYVQDPEVASTLRGNEFKVKYLPYNWGLNGSL
ncbi:MAG: DUF547 domain-containing protein [Pseudomonadota bacterium]